MPVTARDIANALFAVLYFGMLASVTLSTAFGFLCHGVNACRPYRKVLEEISDAYLWIACTLILIILFGGFFLAPAYNR